jgi:hypothetical protein
LVIAGLLSLLPASFLILSGVVGGEYWGDIYMLWGGVFALLSVLVVVLGVRNAEDAGRSPSFWSILLPLAGAWLVSGFALAVIDLTPLCLGQDNGDGRNNLATCLLLTVLWFASVTVPVGLISVGVSALTPKLLARPDV